MPTWDYAIREYRIDGRGDESNLQSLESFLKEVGVDGWELVSVISASSYAEFRSTNDQYHSAASSGEHGFENATRLALFLKRPMPLPS